MAKDTMVMDANENRLMAESVHRDRVWEAAQKGTRADE